jgi:MYXO-CTERM domain-containing protein
MQRDRWTLACGAALMLSIVVASPRAAEAALIEVKPGDTYQKIEGAKAGDIVEIYPGTYKFRVMLQAKGTASKPIIIRAKDPTQRPVWDLQGKAVRDWPGSYTAGDRGRGAWQIKGDHYQISGIVFRNAQDSSSAGIRVVNAGPVTIRDCHFDGNTNGLTGASTDLVVEFCEFENNGKTGSGSPSHNIYIYGGKFTLRYSYLHDPTEGQNFHLRSAEGLVEYNWITRPASYPGDLMSCEVICGGSGTAPITQRLTLRGNVIIQGTPANGSQLIALYNDDPSPSSDSTGKAAKFDLTMINNTVIGTPRGPGKTHKLVNMRNDGIETAVHLQNNIFAGVGELASPYAPGTATWSVDGANNWVQSTATINGTLSGTVKGSLPGFVNATQKDYRLVSSSACVGAATSVAGLPTQEYFENEVTKLQTRARATAKDIGAFERGNQATPTGPYGTPNPPADAGVPTPDGGPAADGATPTADGATPTADGATPTADATPAVDGATPAADGATPTADGATPPADGSARDGSGSDGGKGSGADDGCSVAPASSAGSAFFGVLLMLALVFGWRRRRR